MLTLIFLIVAAVGSQISSAESLAVTIYNNGFGIVKDVRNINFDKGESTLYFTDVAETIQTETVTFKAVDAAQEIRVYEQNFEKNLINQNSILQKYIQKQIDIVADFGDQPKRISGLLLSVSPNIILKTQSGIVSVNRVSAIDLPSIPDGFFTLPTLNWKVNSKQDIKSKCQVAYRATGFSWKADYTLILNSLEDHGDFGGWVTIDNNSGKKYVETKLKLIAGDVNVIQNTPEYAYPMYDDMVMQKSVEQEGAPSFSEKSFADYHMYTLSSPVTLNQSSQKQVEFIPKVYNVTLRKYNEISINTGGYGQQNIKAPNKFRFNNSASVGLGIALPKGTVRVFKEDSSDKSLQFIGEDSIDHTPKNENVTLSTGNAFDISSNLYAEKRQTFSNGYTANMNLTIWNHKEVDTEIEVKLRNSYNDNLQITWAAENSAQLQKVSASQYRIVQILKKNEKVAYKWTETYRA